MVNIFPLLAKHFGIREIVFRVRVFEFRMPFAHIRMNDNNRHPSRLVDWHLRRICASLGVHSVAAQVHDLFEAALVQPFFIHPA